MRKQQGQGECSSCNAALRLMPCQASAVSSTTHHQLQGRSSAGMAEQRQASTSQLTARRRPTGRARPWVRPTGPPALPTPQTARGLLEGGGVRVSEGVRGERGQARAGRASSEEAMHQCSTAPRLRADWQVGLQCSLRTHPPTHLRAPRRLAGRSAWPPPPAAPPAAAASGRPAATAGWPRGPPLPPPASCGLQGRRQAGWVHWLSSCACCGLAAHGMAWHGMAWQA